MDTELKAPTGKTRVVGVDLFDHNDYIVGDYDTPDEAIRVVDENNSRARRGSMDDIYYAFNDQGDNVRANETGSHRVSP